MVLKWLFLGDTGEETLHPYCLGFLGRRALQSDRVISVRCLEIVGHSVVTQRGKTSHSPLRSPRTEVFEVIEFYTDDASEMAIYHDTGGNRLHIDKSGLPGYRAFRVHRVLLERWS